MNKKWTDQKYIVHFVLSMLVLTLSGGVTLGMDLCRSESMRSQEAGIVSAGISTDELKMPYTASGQRTAIVRTLIQPENGEPDAQRVQGQGSEGTLTGGYGEETAAHTQADEKKAESPLRTDSEGSADRMYEEELTAADLRETGGQGRDTVQSQLLSEKDYEALLRIVQAEAGNEDLMGKILVANVVLNRVSDERFPMSVYEVVFQKSGGRAQFSPISSGSYYRVEVTSETKEAVDRALAGEDYSQGALYFAARRYAGENQMRWFDECLEKLFVYGGHEFFKG